MTRTKDNLFKPEKLSVQAKAEQTSSAAKEILALEASDRQKKTERLRALRLGSAVTKAEPQPTKMRKKQK